MNLVEVGLTLLAGVISFPPRRCPAMVPMCLSFLVGIVGRSNVGPWLPAGSVLRPGPCCATRAHQLVLRRHQSRRAGTARHDGRAGVARHALAVGVEIDLYEGLACTPPFAPAS